MKNRLHEYSAVIYNNYVIHLIDREREKQRECLNNSGPPHIYVIMSAKARFNCHPDPQATHQKKRKKNMRRGLKRGGQNEKVQPNVNSASSASAPSQAPSPVPTLKFCGMLPHSTLHTMSPSTFSFSAQCSMTTR